MNVTEGARRMRRAGRWVVLLSLAGMALSAFSAFICYVFRQNTGALFLILPLLMIAFPGAILWLAGWIVDGFAKDSH